MMSILARTPRKAALGARGSVAVHAPMILGSHAPLIFSTAFTPFTPASAMCFSKAATSIVPPARVTAKKCMWLLLQLAAVAGLGHVPGEDYKRCSETYDKIFYPWYYKGASEDAAVATALDALAEEVDSILAPFYDAPADEAVVVAIARDALFRKMDRGFAAVASASADTPEAEEPEQQHPENT